MNVDPTRKSAEFEPVKRVNGQGQEDLLEDHSLMNLLGWKIRHQADGKIEDLTTTSGKTILMRENARTANVLAGGSIANYAQHLFGVFVNKATLKHYLPFVNFHEFFPEFMKRLRENKFTHENLTDDASKLADLVKGKSFIDLGSGAPTQSYSPRFFAQLFKASRYIGVDIKPFSPKIVENEFPISPKEKFKSYFFHFDMNRFLDYVKPVTQDKKVFFLSGINNESSLIFDSIEQKISILSEPGDVLILGPSHLEYDSEENLTEAGFVRQDLFKDSGTALISPVKVYVKAA